MFKLSTRSRYAVKALAELSLNAGNLPVPISYISIKQGIPKDYLEQILHKLNRAGLVKSFRGPSGGYNLKKNARDIKLGEIVEIMENKDSLVLCLGKSAGAKKCSKVENCCSHPVCADIEKKLSGTLNAVTIAKIAKSFAKEKNDQKNSLPRQ